MLFILSSHLQNILILGYYDYVAGLKIGRSSLLHSTNIYYILLGGINCVWECRSGWDSLASAFRNLTIYWDRVKSLHQRRDIQVSGEHRWGQGLNGDSWGTRMNLTPERFSKSQTWQGWLSKSWLSLKNINRVSFNTVFLRFVHVTAHVSGLCLVAG